jgi:hypothetical protein
MRSLGQPDLSRGEPCSPSGQEIANLGTVVHGNDTMAGTGGLECPVSTPIDSDFLNVDGGDSLGPMGTTLRSIRRQGGALLAAACVVATLSACSGDDTTVSSTQPSSRFATTLPVSTDSLRIEMHIGDDLATATLAGTPAARDLAAMLPLQLDLSDPMGQAKSGRLPGSLDLTGAEPVFDPAVGELYYWPPSDTIAIFYEDFGHSIPDPGLVRVGTVDSGMDRIAEAGNDFTVRMDFLPSPASDYPDRSD